MRKLFTLPGAASICLALSLHDRELKEKRHGKRKGIVKAASHSRKAAALKKCFFFFFKPSNVIEREESGNFHLATMMIHNLTPL